MGLRTGLGAEAKEKRKYNTSGLGNREYGRRDASRWPRATPYPQKLALTSAISGGRSVGIVRGDEFFSFSLQYIEARGSVVVKALCYKAEDRRFKNRWMNFFSIYLILPAALGPGVYSASNRNEYQKQKNNHVSGE
jgi:hypothetical protein